MSADVREGLIAGAVAAVLSGIPSTVHAVATGRDPLEAATAAGSLALPDEDRTAVLIAAAVPVHLTISLGWGVMLAHLLPRRRTTLWGALVGAGIAAFDLAVIGRKFPRIAALPAGPQVADHLAFGAVVGSVLARLRDDAG